MSNDSDNVGKSKEATMATATSEGNDGEQSVIDEFLLEEEDLLGGSDNGDENNNDDSDSDDYLGDENELEYQDQQQQEDSLDPEFSKQIAGYDTGDERDDSLDPEFSRQIAGYDPEMDDTLQQKDMLQMDEEEPSDRSFSERGIVRAFFVLGATGIIVLLGSLFWNLMFGNSSPSPETVEEETEETVPFEQDETGRLKAQMAFNDQRRSVRDAQAQEETQEENEQPESPSPSPSPSPSRSQQEKERAEPTTTRREPTTVSPSSAARPRRTFSSLPDEPEPPPQRPSPQRPSPQRPSPPPPPEPEQRTVPVLSSSPPPPPEPEDEDVDPFARWNQLASLGQSRVSTNIDESGRTTRDTGDRSIRAIGGETPIPTPAQTQPTEAVEANRIPTVVISESSAVKPPSSSSTSSSDPSSDPQFSTPGERGILLRRRVVDNTIAASNASNRLLGDSSRVNTGTRQDSYKYKQIPLGTTVPARVAVPMYWDEGQGNALGQNYVIVLEEPLRSASGEVALPKGTALITEIVSVSSTRLVNQQVVAIAYQENGEVIQHEVNPNTFSIRGANNEPLIASGYFDSGGDIAKQDILISLLSSVGKVGEIVNLPQSVSSSSASSGGDTTTTSTSTTTTREDPDLLGAALQGFFQPLADSLRQRSQTQTQELVSRANIAVVPQGTTVSVVVESFLYVQ